MIERTGPRASTFSIATSFALAPLTPQAGTQHREFAGPIMPSELPNGVNSGPSRRHMSPFAGTPTRCSFGFAARANGPKAAARARGEADRRHALVSAPGSCGQNGG
jgi:hypothetical protein